MNKIIKNTQKFESKSMHGQVDIVWDKAINEHIVISNGKKLIDFTSTIFVTNIGHSNKYLVKSIINALNSNLIHTYNYYNKYRSDYLKELINYSKPYFQKAYLVSAGTEATEAALKIMRLNSIKINKKKPGIICLKGNWHGRTMGSQMMSGNDDQKKWIGYHDPNIHHINFPYPWDVDESNIKFFFDHEMKNLKKNKNLNFKTDICGIMIETFQGWGAIFYYKKFIKLISQFAKNNNILICFDEMQAGFGRTGKKFGFMHYDISPDLVCVGKGMGSGFPISGVLGKEKYMDLAPIGSMSSTHSANPISCVAGLATLKELKKRNLIQKSFELGKIISKRFQTLQKKHSSYISYVSSKGLIGAIIFKKNGKPLTNLANEICDLCLSKGLLVVKTNRESIKIGPPLIISKKNLINGLNILEDSIGRAILNLNK